MDEKIQTLIAAGRMLRYHLSKDPRGVEMATGAYTETEVMASLAAFDMAVAAIDQTARTMHGFDLTDFGTTGWQTVCSDLGLTFHGRAPHQSREGEEQGWAWRNVVTGLLVVTAVNPDTGEHYASDSFHSKQETGYASYMGIEGNAAVVANAVEVIRKNSTYIKDECAGRRDYI